MIETFLLLNSKNSKLCGYLKKNEKIKKLNKAETKKILLKQNEKKTIKKIFYVDLLKPTKNFICKYLKSCLGKIPILNFSDLAQMNNKYFSKITELSKLDSDKTAKAVFKIYEKMMKKKLINKYLQFNKSYQVPKISGLYYFPNFISGIEEQLLLKLLKKSSEWASITNSKNSRQVIQYGYTYSYDRSGLKPATEIPDFYLNLIKRVKKYSIDAFKNIKLDQLLINKYEPGQGISAHIDNPKQFEDNIVCLSIGDSAIFDFSLTSVIKVPIERRSLYIMSGDSRYKYKHAFKHPKSKKNKRISLTFRKTKVTK